jgi:hypothetical protein
MIDNARGRTDTFVADPAEGATAGGTCLVWVTKVTSEFFARLVCRARDHLLLLGGAK